MPPTAIKEQKGSATLVSLPLSLAKDTIFYADRDCSYTQMNSKIGNFSRKRLEFETALAAPKQLNLKSLAMQAVSKSMAV